MGIKGLMGFLAQNAPASIKQTSLAALGGRKIAIDASMSLYQIIIAIQSGTYGSLTNDRGEITSHIKGTIEAPWKDQELLESCADTDMMRMSCSTAFLKTTSRDRWM